MTWKYCFSNGFHRTPSGNPREVQRFRSFVRSIPDLQDNWKCRKHLLSSGFNRFWDHRFLPQVPIGVTANSCCGKCTQQRGNIGFPMVFQGFRITIIFPRFLRSGPGPDSALAGLGCKKHKEFQWFPIGFPKNPVSPAGGLPSLAVRAPAADSGNNCFPTVSYRFLWFPIVFPKVSYRFPKASYRFPMVFLVKG